MLSVKNKVVNRCKQTEILNVGFIVAIGIVMSFINFHQLKLMIHTMWAIFLLAVGIFSINNRKYKPGKIEVYYGVTSLAIGILECIFLYKYKGYTVYGYTENLDARNMLFMVRMYFCPIITTFFGLKLTTSKEGPNKSIVEFFLSIITIVIFLLIAEEFFVSSHEYDYVINKITAATITNVLLVAMFFRIRKYRDVLDGEEKLFYKRFLAIAFLAEFPEVVHLVFNNVRIENLYEEIICAVSLLYSYRYINHITIRETKSRIHVNEATLQKKTKDLREKNKMLIMETNTIEKLKKELTAQEERLQSTLDISSSGIIVFTTKTDITFANTTFNKVFRDKNLKLEQYVNNYDYLVEKVSKVFDDHEESKMYVYTQDGKIFETKLTPLKKKNKISGVLCVFKDKTKKKISERKIHEANERYENFLDSVGDGIVVIQDEEIIYVNKECKKMFKTETCEFDFLESCKKGQFERMYRIGRDIIYVELDYSIYEKDGKDTYIIMVRDVTDRKLDKIRLQDSQTSYSKFIDALPDGICLLGKDFRVNYINKSMVRMLGMDSYKTVRGHSIIDYFAASQINRGIKDYLEDSLQTKTNVSMIPQEIICTDGKHKDVAVSIVTFTQDNRLVVFMIVKDLEYKKEFKLAETELLDRFRADKIKTEFFANMSHELKTPLNVISSSNQLVEAYYKNGKIEDYRDNINLHVELVKKSSYRLQRLINNIIDLTKMVSGNYHLRLAKYNIVEVVEDLFMDTEPYTSKKGLSIVFDTEEEEMLACVDRIEFERVLLNLLSNCIKCTEPGGNIKIMLTRDDDYIHISVKDTGVGIPADKLDIIFEEFSQVDKTLSRNSEGSGIGLSVAKNLIELHGGNIRVESEVDKGTEFLIDIPVVYSVFEVFDEDKRIYNIKEKIKIEFSDIYY
ncbi:MAG: PAS domain S-box protein [Clostridioides sp.]|nr:PAS domain S-box protein [Clostridioides sp.]